MAMTGYTSYLKFHFSKLEDRRNECETGKLRINLST
jgi:hypothetical protein